MTRTVHVVDVVAFVILKALALISRYEPKDAADIIHVLRYSGTLEDSYKTIGPVGYAQFHHAGGGENELLQAQRFAAGLVCSNPLLGAIAKQWANSPMVWRSRRDRPIRPTDIAHSIKLPRQWRSNYERIPMGASTAPTAA